MACAARLLLLLAVRAGRAGPWLSPSLVEVLEQVEPPCEHRSESVGTLARESGRPEPIPYLTFTHLEPFAMNRDDEVVEAPPVESVRRLSVRYLDEGRQESLRPLVQWPPSYRRAVLLRA